MSNEVQVLPWYFLLLIALTVINGLTALAFYVDKKAAKARQWRISEKTLLILTLFGGAPAALWAMKRFRHKTGKSGFYGRVQALLLLQLVAAAVVVRLLFFS